MTDYLGIHITIFLQQEPFTNWPVERSIEDDLDEQIIHYVFAEHGLELRCDCEDRISVIFLYADDYNGFDQSLLEIPFSRSEVLEGFGTPTKSGLKVSDPILGEYGAWDRFTRSGHTIHVEYCVDSDRIKKLTLMRNDTVP